MTEIVDSIAAIATASGPAGIGILRVSGPACGDIARRILGKDPTPRYAHFLSWRDDQGDLIDQGLLLYFVAPHSFTGEDVLEFQGHGSLPLLRRGLQQLCRYGARRALPGEFSQRAFLNGRMDLTQAEAIADLISAQSDAAARAALRSMQGVFATRVTALQQSLIQLRVHVEAAIDFAEEEIDFLADQAIVDQLTRITEALQTLQREVENGLRLRDGLKVVLLGAPNAGKSSLLNVLSGTDRAIVSAHAGTTRDIVEEHLQFDGASLTLADTAGLRDSDDDIEREGIRRTRQALRDADLILAVLDGSAADLQQQRSDLQKELPSQSTTLWLINKVDLRTAPVETEHEVLPVSSKTGQGIAQLQERLTELASSGFGEGTFSARQRHQDALSEVSTHLGRGQAHLSHRQGELLAEELRLAQLALSEITGEYLSDDLLGAIFSSFCIGK